ncbi:MAG: hypothetical protein MUC85_05155 [Anaerolineales bacterium]|jgi:hypothetical protein|nr:hypothetical protein [Anaerolineales bacterium]
MRTIKTIFLRLLVDTEEPHALRGVLHTVSEDVQYPFTDEQSLVSLLQQMITTRIVQPDQAEYDENNLESNASTIVVI